MFKSNSRGFEAAGGKEKRQKRFLIGQLASYGDCLYATAVARQIKSDYPGCHLTWAVASFCRSILIGNPYIDEIWEFPMDNTRNIVEDWKRFEKKALGRKRNRDFDEIFLTQFSPGNIHRFDGILRTTIFRGYPSPITVPVDPIVRLDAREIENVRAFAEKHHLSERSNVILFECSAGSDQSFLTPDFAIQVSKNLVEKHRDIAVILSSNSPMQSIHDRMIDGSVLSFKENAELTKYCSLLVGCSSGISWLTTSDWAKPLPMVQLLKRGLSSYASFIHDFEARGVSTDSVIEMTDCSPERVAECVGAVLDEGFKAARERFHEEIPQTFKMYTDSFIVLVGRMKLFKLIQLISINIQRYGLNLKFILCHFGVIKGLFHIIWLRIISKPAY